jgi:DNA repair exonuclease SbcCD nuclease subunit
VINGSRPTRYMLHTSDLHLESLEDRSFHDFTSLIVAARQTKADLVVIAGDLFDSQRVKDNLIHFVVEELRNLAAQVVILPGNHDCLTPASAYGRSTIWEDWPNIKIFRSPGGETVRYPDLKMTLWGKAVTSYDEEIAPLEGIPRPEGNGSWNIAVAHGFYIGDDPPYSPSYQITRQEIMGSGWDYIALGHVPVFNVICDEPVMACYSGSPQTSGGFLLVNLCEETGIKLSRYSATAGLIQIP